MIFGGWLVPALNTMMMAGGSTTGAILLVGLGVGLTASAAAIIVVGASLYVHTKNEWDIEQTRQEARHIYFVQYWPRFVKFAWERLKATPGHAILQPMTFEEFYDQRGYRNTTFHSHPR